MGEVVHMPPRDLNPDQKVYWHEEAASAEVRTEELQAELEYQLARRAYALTMLGMLPGTQL